MKFIEYFSRFCDLDDKYYCLTFLIPLRRFYLKPPFLLRFLDTPSSLLLQLLIPLKRRLPRTKLPFLLWSFKLQILSPLLPFLVPRRQLSLAKPAFLP